MESNARLVDIRELYGPADLCIHGALHLKSSTLQDVIGHHISSREAVVICYCHDGTLSVLAADALHRMGYLHAGLLIGGLRQWIRFGLPVRRLGVIGE